MFKNIGAKMKSLAKLHIVFAMTLASFAGGIVYSMIEKTTGGSVAVFALCLVVSAVLGFCFGYIGAMFIYAYGEIVGNIQEMNRKMDLCETNIENAKAPLD